MVTKTDRRFHEEKKTACADSRSNPRENNTMKGGIRFCINPHTADSVYRARRADGRASIRPYRRSSVSNRPRTEGSGRNCVILRNNRRDRQTEREREREREREANMARGFG